MKIEKINFPDANFELRELMEKVNKIIDEITSLPKYMVDQKDLSVKSIWEGEINGQDIVRCGG